MFMKKPMKDVENAVDAKKPGDAAEDGFIKTKKGTKIPKKAVTAFYAKKAAMSAMGKK
jgi:hypothetical protein